MKKTLTVALVLLVVCTFGSAYAALQNNGNGLFYDTDLDITWYFFGLPGTWDVAMDTAASLTVGGTTAGSWRLPTTSATGLGEMGHLYYDELGNAAGGPPTNFGPIPSNLTIWNCWTGTEHWVEEEPAYRQDQAWAFDFSTGSQFSCPKGSGNWGTLMNVLAVHSGNVGGPPPPPAGTWYFQVFTDNTSTNEPGWGSGTMILDSTGAVTGGTVINDSGVTKTLTGGSFIIDSAGQAAGTVTLSDGTVESLPHGKLDAGKTVLTMVNSDPNYRGLFVAAKSGGTFAQADLAGTWYFQVFTDNKSTNAPNWAAGAMDLDSTGALSGGTVINDSGVTKTLTGGSFTIDSVGQATGTVTLSDGTESLPHGKLNAGKTVLAMVNTDQSNRGLFVALKGGGTFTQADLAGTWYVQAVADKPSGNNPYWASGTMLVNTTGAVTGGTLVNSFGETKQLTGGSFAIDSLGRFSGSFLQSDGQSGNVPYGKLDSGKGILIMVASDTSNRGLFIAAKGGTICSGDLTSDGDVDGSDLAALIANQTLLDLSTFAQNFGKNSCQ